jgi:putative FmdB family regulatory protein
MAKAERDQAMSGIGDQRHSRVADQRDFCAPFERDEQFRCPGEFVMLVVADQGLADFVVTEEFLCVPGVFAGDLVDLFQNAQRAKSDVFEIADRRANQVQAAQCVFRVSHRGSAHATESSTRRRTGRHCEQKSPEPATFAASGTGRACYTFLFGNRAEGFAVPLYEYKCVKCGRHTDKIEAVAGPHLKKCPHCGGKVESVITAPAIKFKGSGWYVTDYAGKSPDGGSKEIKSAAESKDTGAKDSGVKDSKDSGSKESSDKDSSAKDTSSKDSSSKDKKSAKKK